jgi:hypothetical protein
MVVVVIMVVVVVVVVIMVVMVVVVVVVVIIMIFMVVMVTFMALAAVMGALAIYEARKVGLVMVVTRAAKEFFPKGLGLAPGHLAVKKKIGALLG